MQDSYILANIWAAHREKEIFPQGGEFEPWRLINTDGSMIKTDKITYFSSGRQNLMWEWKPKPNLLKLLLFDYQGFSIQIPQQSVSPTLCIKLQLQWRIWLLYIQFCDVQCFGFLIKLAFCFIWEGWLTFPSQCELLIVTLVLFTTGRRMCPGEQMVKNETFLYVSNTLQRYTIKLPPGKPKPTLRDHGGLIRSPHHYDVLIEPRGSWIFNGSIPTTQSHSFEYRSS